MKKLTYLLMLLAALSGAAVYAGSLNNAFVCSEDDWADEEDADEDEYDDEADEDDADEEDADEDDE